MIKLVRFVKFFNNFHHVSKSVMKTTVATERLIFFVLVLVLGFHLCNCLWVWVAIFFHDSFETTWIKKAKRDQCLGYLRSNSKRGKVRLGSVEPVKVI